MTLISLFELGLVLQQERCQVLDGVGRSEREKNLMNRTGAEATTNRQV